MHSWSVLPLPYCLDQRKDNENGKIKLVYQGAFAIPDAEEACVVTLTDAQEKRALSIVTDKPMANEIKFRQLDKDVKHPHLVDVLARMIW